MKYGGKKIHEKFMSFRSPSSLTSGSIKGLHITHLNTFEQDFSTVVKMFGTVNTYQYKFTTSISALKGKTVLPTYRY